jgi:hypothetical protein
MSALQIRFEFAVAREFSEFAHFLAMMTPGPHHESPVRRNLRRIGGKTDMVVFLSIRLSRSREELNSETSDDATAALTESKDADPNARLFIPFTSCIEIRQGQ